MKTIVSEKGQITIPKALRDRLGIKAGQILDFVEVGGRLVARKSRAADPIDQVYGILKTRQPTNKLIEMLRGPVEGR